MKRAIVFALLMLPVVGNAADSKGAYSIVLPKDGTIGSCGTYVVARDEGRRGDYRKVNDHSAWLMGYLTGYNARTSDTYDIMGNKDLQSLLLWLENYCKQHPLDSFAVAVNFLIIELYPTRARTAPKEATP